MMHGLDESLFLLAVLIATAFNLDAVLSVL